MADAKAFDWAEIFDGMAVSRAKRETGPKPKEVPEFILAMAKEWSENMDEVFTYSFRKGGEKAATEFVENAKNAGPHVNRTIKATRNGIVVSVYAIAKIGRKPKGDDNGDSDTSESQ